ncbi:hypothetical protein [Lysobacter enzymogenes]|uniref:hypothetical protein n=1 Tax=Lysobacter enzymogenes TaxID=69 RepID=UPI001AFA69B2|nr:hypothetical protein [Lysobacter enzymogenes]QQQ00912.1 hypothetical protein JHW41_23070 [Lysobacter enzymogenes]
MKNATQHTGPDELLATLDARILDAVEATLSNDEGSTDAEMAQHLMELGLSEAQSKRAICYRALYTLYLWVGEFTPIRSGIGLRYNGTTGQFEVA